MISFDKALELVLEYALPKPVEYVSLENAYGRILAENILSDVDIPPANMSSMDGYACRFCDQNLQLRVIETIAAGYAPTKNIEPGTCSRIMTGAMVPEGADCVVMFEDTQEANGIVTIHKPTKNKNIRFKAEDGKCGDVLLQKGTFISPSVCAVLATSGRKNIPVSQKPVVGIIATGNELVEPEIKPTGPEIRNSNSYQFYAQVLKCGCSPQYFGIVKDSPEAIKSAIARAESQSDVILISGGVSAGDFDYVPDALKSNGFELLVEKIAIKPGKPTVFCKKGNKFAFGMSGNPAAGFVLFELLVRPFLLKMMGHSYSPILIHAPLARDIKKKQMDRIEILPVKISSHGHIEKVDYHGSAHIHAYSEAEGFLRLEGNIEILPAESIVRVQLLEKGL